jgi:hypothetical protein
MGPLHSLVVVALSLFTGAGIVGARPISAWSDEELLAKSDLVVIAIPTSTHDIRERFSYPSICFHRPVVGVETTFAVSAVLKGDYNRKQLILHHYRLDNDRIGNAFIVNGPLLVFFDPARKQTFRLFLVRESDGVYNPVSGQTDALLSVKSLGAKKAAEK